MAGVEGAASEGAPLLTGVLRPPSERPVEPVSEPPRPLVCVVPSLSVLPVPKSDEPLPSEVEPVMVAVAAASVAGFVSATFGFTSAVVVVVVPSGFADEEAPKLNSDVADVDPVDKLGVGVAAFSGVVFEEKNDVIPGCFAPKPLVVPAAAGAVVVVAVVVVVFVGAPSALERLGKLLALESEEVALNDKLVLTFGFVGAVPDENEKPANPEPPAAPVVAAGV